MAENSENSNSNNMIAHNSQCELNTFVNMTPNVVFRNSGNSLPTPTYVPQIVPNNAQNSSNSNNTNSRINLVNEILSNVSTQEGNKKSSFQITSVTTVIDSSTSNDGGDDSETDLDESRTEESQEIIDVPRNLLPSQNDFSRNDTIFNISGKYNSVPVIPTSSNFGLAIVDEAGHHHNSETPILSTEHSEHDHVQHRFKVVKILSSGAFKKGRWNCMDFFDESMAGNDSIRLQKGVDSFNNSLQQQQQQQHVNLQQNQEQIQHPELSFQQQLPPQQQQMQQQASPINIQQNLEPEQHQLQQQYQPIQQQQQPHVQQTTTQTLPPQQKQQQAQNFETDLAQLAQHNSNESHHVNSTAGQTLEKAGTQNIPQQQQHVQQQHSQSNVLDGSASGSNTVAIDNKIEQAMDLVKSHLMFAVREEVEVLKEKISELMDRISQLEYENTILKAHASHETLETLAQLQTKSSQLLGGNPNSNNNNNNNNNNNC